MTKLYTHKDRLIDLEFRNLYGQRKKGSPGSTGPAGPAGPDGVIGGGSPIKVLKKTLVTVGYLQTRGPAACPYVWDADFSSGWFWEQKPMAVVAQEYLDYDKFICAGPDSIWGGMPVFPLLNSPVPILILRAYIHVIEPFINTGYDYWQYIATIEDQIGLFLYVANDEATLIHPDYYGQAFAWTGYTTLFDEVYGERLCPKGINLFNDVQILGDTGTPRDRIGGNHWRDPTLDPPPLDTRLGRAWGGITDTQPLIGHKINIDLGFQTFFQPGYFNPADAPNTPFAGGAAQITVVYRELT